MQPTVDAELAGVRRSLDAIAAEYHLSPDVTRDLAAASRTLQRVERSWSRVLPYLASDSAATAEVLRSLVSLLDAPLRSDVEDALSAAESAPDAASLDVTVANARHEALRALLARAIADLPPGQHAAGPARARIAACLRESLDNRPW